MAPEDLKYYPYYTDIEAMNTYKEGDSLYSVEYSPSALAEPVMPSVDDKYLEIPEENMDSIRRFCESAGITEKDSVDNVLQKVYIYFLKNYPYTLHPGATPGMRIMSIISLIPRRRACVPIMPLRGR